MLDKVFLFLFGLEWLGFGVMGLFFPEIITGLLGVYEYSANKFKKKSLSHLCNFPRKFRRG